MMSADTYLFLVALRLPCVDDDPLMLASLPPAFISVLEAVVPETLASAFLGEEAALAEPFADVELLALTLADFATCFAWATVLPDAATAADFFALTAALAEAAVLFEAAIASLAFALALVEALIAVFEEAFTASFDLVTAAAEFALTLAFASADVLAALLAVAFTAAWLLSAAWLATLVDWLTTFCVVVAMLAVGNVACVATLVAVAAPTFIWATLALATNNAAAKSIGLNRFFMTLYFFTSVYVIIVFPVLP